MMGFDFQAVLGMDSSINTTKIYFPELDDVVLNKLNYYSKSSERIDELAEEIASDGLREPCVAYLDENDNYILLSGETRYRSCKELVKQGRSYSFHGKDITGKIPITLDQKPRNIHFERLAITGSNNKRNSLSSKEKEEMIRNTVDDLNALAAMNEFDWSGRKTWEVVAAKTGLSGHYVREYLAGKMTRDRKISADKDSEEFESIVTDDAQKEFKKTLRALRNTAKQISIAHKHINEDDEWFEKLELLIASKLLYEDLADFIDEAKIDDTLMKSIKMILSSDAEISLFVELGDEEALVELLKARNGTMFRNETIEILFQNNKAVISCKNTKTGVISVSRLTKILLDYSKVRHHF